MRNKTLIEINGKQYDTQTGQVIGSGQSTPPAFKGIRSQAIQQAAKALDGVAHRPHTQPAQKQQETIPAPAVLKSHNRAPAGHVAHHAAQRSQTLMRAAVKKPAKRQLDPKYSSTGHLFSAHASHAAAEKEESLRHPLHASRIERAKTIGKSQHISKFNHHDASIEKTTAHVPVRPAPSHAAPPITHVRGSLRHAADSTTSDRFTHAIQSATSHQQQAAQRHGLHRRLAQKAGVTNKRLTVISSALAVLLLAGFMAYQEMPNFTMRVAAARAGFQATMPEYKPAGFVLADRIQHHPGEVTVSYKSTSDARAYKVTQRPSNWTSETLLDQVIAATKQPYQTFQDKGRVIYIWGDNATWVDSGVWFQVTGDSSLTSAQLLRIASSL